MVAGESVERGWSVAAFAAESILRLKQSRRDDPTPEVTRIQWSTEDCLVCLLEITQAERFGHQMEGDSRVADFGP